MAEEIHVGDIGTLFEVTLQDQSVTPAVAVDLTGATVLEIIFKIPPDGKVVKTATIKNPPGTDGIIQYTTVVNDLSVAGTWEIQGRIVLPSGTWSSSTEEFLVHPNL